MGVAHFALDLGLRHQGRHRVDDDDVDGAGADQDLDDLERLLAGVGLADEEVVDLHPDPGGVDGVEGVLGVDEGGDAALLLGLRDDVQRQGRLAGRLRAVDLDDPALGDAPDSKREVERQRARRDGLDLTLRPRFTKAHDRSLPVGALDGGECGSECFVFAFQFRDPS